MSKVLNVSNGDYRVRVQTGGSIILDTQSTYGKVLVIGDLDVQGQLTYIESTNTQVKDNILQLNYGQTGNGIRVVDAHGNILYVSGIEIERGNYSAAQILFDEQVQHYDPVSSTEVYGTFSLRTADGILSGLQVASIANSGTTDFVFDMQGSSNVLRVANSLGGYENNINNDNDLITKKFLSNYITATNGVATVDRIYFPISGGIGSSTSSIEAFGSSIVFQISQATRAIISPTGVSVDNINLYSNTISNTGSNNLVLAAANNNVEINSVLNLDNQGSTPSYTTGTTKIYSSATAGPGGTGIYFTNDQASHTADELISRRRAVALSILL